MIDLEIKSQLAKLLATEDLIVENSHQATTASFDVNNRVLTLPIWKRASSIVYDLLVGHEVGHALYTPNVDPPQDINPQFLNVVEDVRIEKLMKRKYPGMGKTFYNGYKTLVEDNFFGIEENELPETNLGDRINLYFKGGNHMSIPFSEEEKPIVDLVGAVETWEDTLHAARVLFDFCSQEVPKQKEEIKLESDESGKSDPNSTPESGKPGEEKQQPTQGQQQKKPEIETGKNLESKLQELIDDRACRSSLYAEIPDIDLSEYVIKNSRVHREIGSYFEEQLKPLEFTDAYGRKQTAAADFSQVDDDYKQFKNSAQKEVNYLVKEFECRKSADSYARSTSSRTGVLECSKLHAYKYEEDLFKKISVIPDGKSHGLIFILDWSGSMAHCMMDTIRQLYNLIWFCKKVQIPFDVYAFTNSYNYRNQQILPVHHHKAKQNDLVVDDEFSLLHFFTSNTKKVEMDKQLKNIWRLAYAFDHNVSYVAPGPYYLSGTPLNETIVCLHKLIPEFKKQTKCQKVHCVILTDGEAPPLPVYYPYTSMHDKERMGTRHLIPGSSFLRNRKTGYTYAIPSSFYDFSKVLLDDLRQTFPDVNFIGIRLMYSRDLRQFVTRHQDGEVTEVQMKKFRKEKSCMIPNAGYHQYFGILTNSLFNDTEFEVQEDASKTQIKSAFMKSLRSKSLNKKVLNQFVELIA